MIIHCQDKSDGKLFLAIEFISFLCKNASQVAVTCPANKMQVYEGVQKIFNNLTFSPEPSDNYQVVFSDKPDLVTSADIIYPIFKTTVAIGSTNRNFVPLDALPAKEIAGYYIGEINSAKLMFQKSVTTPIMLGQKILISAGPTAEDLDPVRFLTNRSTGKMGIELAKAAYIKGGDVELILGPGKATAPAIIKTTHVRSAEEMAKAVLLKFPETNIYIGAAAIADYTPRSRSIHKLKKQTGDLSIEFSRTLDILKALAKIRKGQKIIGFSVETQQEIQNSKKKLLEKNLDMIVINNPSEAGSGFGTDTNRVTVLLKNGEKQEFPLQTKQQLSMNLLDIISEIESLNE